MNPEAPWQVVLEKERGGRWWLAFVAILYCGIGAAGAVSAALKGLRRLFVRSGVTG